jgi:hypothetical protein
MDERTEQAFPFTTFDVKLIRAKLPVLNKFEVLKICTTKYLEINTYALGRQGYIKPLNPISNLLLNSLCLN